MSVISKIKTVYLESDCGAEDAEQLLEWLLAHPKGGVNLKKCTHLHGAVLQVLMVIKPKLTAVPSSQDVLTIIRASDLLAA